MIKIKRSNLIFFLFLVIALAAISSCSKTECKTSADCLQRTCFLSKCEGSKCSYAMQRNCCGNRINETIENGRTGSQCTCPEDYGKCEGKGKIRIGSRYEDAVFMRYLCSVDSQCVLGVDKKDITPQNFLDGIYVNPGFFRASSVVKYNKPFDVAKDSFVFRITLDDMGKDLVLPIRITKVKLLYSGENSRSELLISEKDLDTTLNGVGDSALINVPLTLDYKPQELEEQGSVRYSIDYTFTRLVLGGRTANGTSIYSIETTRGTFSASAKPTFFVRSVK